MSGPFVEVPFRYWVLAARPKTLPASVASVVLGTAVAVHDGFFSLLTFVLCLICALLLQIGVNFANDYFDFRAGHDTAERLGPVRVSQQGLISADQLWRALTGIMAAATVCGLGLVVIGGWPVLALGVLSLLGVLAYSGGPRPLASHALGDIAVFVFFGLVAVCGSYYLQTSQITGRVLLLACGIGALNTAILVVNNIRDRHTDAKSGKKTLAVRLGKQRSVSQYRLLLLLALMIPLALWSLGSLPLLSLLGALLLAPQCHWLAGRLTRLDGRVLNFYLAQTAKLTLTYSVLISFGLIISG